MHADGRTHMPARRIVRRMLKQPSRDALRARRLASVAPIDTRVLDLSAWNRLRGRA